MNILVTLDSGYIAVLQIMLKSLLISNPDTMFEIYVMNSTLTSRDFTAITDYLQNNPRIQLIDIKINDDMLNNAPITDRYPKEMYYRIFAAQFLPKDVDRVLYLDPDLVVLKNLNSLYNVDMDGYYFAAASHVGRILTNINALRLQMDDKAPYINSGVMVMNIDLLRKEQDFDCVFNYIEKNKHLLVLPDQDVISAVYGGKIIRINPYIYNMTERLLLLPSTVEKGITPEWVKNNSVIVHFCGRNKPWKNHYVGVLGHIYHEFENAQLPK